MGLLDGKVALVTGSSRGLGRAIARVLAREGADVAINYARDEAAAAAAVDELRGLGRRAWAHRASVSDRSAVRAMVAAIEADAGQLDILVNNAGHGQVVPLALMEEDDWDRMMAVHLKGAFVCTQAVLRGMVRRRAGRIINVSSLAGVKMMQAPVHYATAKAGLKGFTESLAKEIGRYGITVNAIAPGILDEGVSDNLPPARKEEYLRHCALRRVGTLDEAAEVVAFLASGRASYLNGSTIVIDGAV
jgi:NAD(P)-dependent dehydrogenase (short-subunit alcohol dehydrogenase family)